MKSNQNLLSIAKKQTF